MFYIHNVPGRVPNSQTATKKIRDCLLFFSVIILFIGSPSTYADTDSDQAPVDEN